MLHQVVQRAVLSEPFHRRFRADFLHARYVVYRVAGQRQVIQNALRRHAKFGVHTGNVQRLVVHGVDQNHVLVDQLREILVAGGDDAAHAIPRRLLHQRADHVVGLHAFQHQQVPAGRGDGPVQRFDLTRQVVRHRRTVRLVFGVHVVAESFAFCVKYAQAIIRRVIVAQLAQHVEHAVDRAGRFAVAVAQIRHRMERAVQEG